MRKIAWVIILLALALSPRGAWAWGASGHMLAAAVAFQELPPAKRDAIGQLLAEHPDFAQRWRSGMAASRVAPAEFLMMRASVWADDIRGNAHPLNGLHLPSAHFINKKFAPVPHPGQPDPQPTDILREIACQRQIVADPQQTKQNRAIALAWLLHLVGDVHQPFHSVALVSPAFPRGDRGGNSFKIQPTEGSDNLHSLWDDLHSHLRSFRELDQQAGLLKGQFRRAGLPELGSPAPQAWADESFEAATRVGYRGATGLLVPGTPPPALPQGYMETARATADRRVTLAGYRLADLLNSLF